MQKNDIFEEHRIDEYLVVSSSAIIVKIVVFFLALLLCIECGGSVPLVVSCTCTLCLGVQISSMLHKYHMNLFKMFECKFRSTF